MYPSVEREIESNNSRLLENVIDFLKYEHVDFSGKLLSLDFSLKSYLTRFNTRTIESV